MKRARWLDCLGDERGTSTVEFVVLLACIAVAFTLAWQSFGAQIAGIIAGE